MPFVYPNYYKDFACIKGECRHSCCIDWEIDIDEESYQRYCAMDGELGDKLRDSITCEGGEYYFTLDEKERCPFLNTHGLCEREKRLFVRYADTIQDTEAFFLTELKWE